MDIVCMFKNTNSHAKQPFNSAIKMETKVHSKTQSCQDVFANIQVLSHIQLECMLHLRIGAPFTEENNDAHITQVVA